MELHRSWIFIFLFCFASSQALAKPKVKVPVTLATKVKNTTCVQQGKRWKRRESRVSKGRNSKFDKQARKTCSSLIPKNSVKGLDDLPSNSGILSSKFQKVKSSSRAVSGTPPTIPAIPSQNIPELFWRPGVVERIAAGSPTPDDCNEFYGGNTDGHSGGFSSCVMTEGTGQALEGIMRSGASLCYMRNFPSLSSGVTVVSGAENVPDGSPSKIFDTPSGESSRLVEINIDHATEEQEAPQTIFIEVLGKDFNKDNKLSYSANLYFCGSSGNQLESIEQMRIGRDGAITNTSTGSTAFDFGEDRIEHGAFTTTVQGYLKRQKSDGIARIEYNERLPRSFNIIEQSSKGTVNFRSSVEITPTNQVRTKQIQEDRKSYAVLNFLGEGVSSAQFLSGGYKDEKENAPDQSFRSLVEYRDSYYAAAPESTIATTLDEVDIATDSFYSESSSASFDQNAFDCTTTSADVVVQLDFNDPALGALAPTCEGEILPDMNYCFSGLVEQAINNFDSVCNAS